MKVYLVGLILALSFNIVNANQSVEQFGDAYFNEMCKRFIACGDHPNVAEMAAMAHIKDVQSCVSTVTKRYNPKKWAKLLDKKLISFNPKFKSACFAGISKLSCDAMSGGFDKPAVIKGCEQVIDGSLALQAECKTSMECKSAGTICMGICREPPLLECGKELCTADQYCDFNAKKCGTPKEVGQACSNFSECKTSSCSEGKCGAGAVVSKPGGSCEGAFVCSIGEECIDKTCTPY